MITKRLPTFIIISVGVHRSRAIRSRVIVTTVNRVFSRMVVMLDVLEWWCEGGPRSRSAGGGPRDTRSPYPRTGHPAALHSLAVTTYPRVGLYPCLYYPM